MKYDLEEALVRIGISKEEGKRIALFNTPFNFGFTTPCGWNTKIFLFSNGDKAKTDLILSHERIHLEDFPKYGFFGGFGKQKELESRAVEESLLKLLDLAKKYPNEGYTELFNDYFNDISEHQNRNKKDALKDAFGERYYRKVNLSRLEKARYSPE